MLARTVGSIRVTPGWPTHSQSEVSRTHGALSPAGGPPPPPFPARWDPRPPSQEPHGPLHSGRELPAPIRPQLLSRRARSTAPGVNLWGLFQETGSQLGPTTPSQDLRALARAWFNPGLEGASGWGPGLGNILPGCKNMCPIASFRLTYVGAC